MTRSTKIRVVRRGASMLFCPASLPLSRQTLTYVTGIIRRHRQQIDSPWRKLAPGQQALLVLAHLRKGETFAELAAGFGIGTATAWRYVTETVGLLAARSPKLRKALAGARQAGHAYVVIDGTLIPIDRVAADRPFYFGKHHRHGMNLQVIATPGRGYRVGVRPAARCRPRPDRSPDLGDPAGTGRLRARGAGGQGLSRCR
jgi:Helix-turn-helix of DDE superfamily endonuclease